MEIGAIPVFAFFLDLESKMDELVEIVFLISVDIKNVRLIWTGPITVSLNHAAQEFVFVIVLTTKGLFFVFIIKELVFLAIELFGDMSFN